MRFHFKLTLKNLAVFTGLYILGFAAARHFCVDTFALGGVVALLANAIADGFYPDKSQAE